MRNGHALSRKERGFTLLEIIVVIIVGSIIGVMMVQFMGTSLTKSAEPIVRVQEIYGLEEVMETIVEEYNGLMISSATPLAGLVTFAGTYTAPYTVTCTYLSGFDGNGNEVAGSSGDNILKVTVGRGDQRLTTLFTR